MMLCFMFRIQELIHGESKLYLWSQGAFKAGKVCQKPGWASEIKNLMKYLAFQDVYLFMPVASSEATIVMRAP